MSKVGKMPPNQKIVYDGPKGRCFCCGKLTDIVLAGTLEKPDVSDWIVPKRVLDHVYFSVTSKIKNDNGRLYLKLDYPLTTLKCFFVEGGTGIAGPFDFYNLKAFLNTYLKHAQFQNHIVYVVPITSLALERISKFYLAHRVHSLKNLVISQCASDETEEPSDFF